MVTTRRIIAIIILLLASVYVFAAEKRYYSYPLVDTLHDDSRLLIYDVFDGVSSSRNISGAALKGAFPFHNLTSYARLKQGATFQNVSVTRLFGRSAGPWIYVDAGLNLGGYPVAAASISTSSVYVSGVHANKLYDSTNYKFKNISTIVGHVDKQSNPHATTAAQVPYAPYTSSRNWPNIQVAITETNRIIPTICSGTNPVYDGADGSPGPRGEAGQIIGLSAVSLPVGTPPTVSNSGNFSQAILNFGLPTGATGATGPKGATGDAGVGADAIFCNLSGGTRSITYDANGANPLPAMSAFAVHVYHGVHRIIADAWIWWTGGDAQRVFGSATTSTFQPQIKPLFSHVSSHNFVIVQARYSSNIGKQYCNAGTPIAVGKIGKVGATGAAGVGTPPGGALNAIQYKYSSVSTKKIFRGFGRYSVHVSGGALIL